MDHEFLRNLSESLSRETKQLKIEYMKKFEAGDRIEEYVLKYVNIIHPIVQERKKGIFVSASTDTIAQVFWEGDSETSLIDVMYIKHIDNA